MNKEAFDLAWTYFVRLVAAMMFISIIIAGIDLIGDVPAAEPNTIWDSIQVVALFGVMFYLGWASKGEK